MSNIIYDESIGRWRFRTQADIEYGKAVIKAAEGEQL